MDLDMRRLRYFVAVAERLHFGRAAAALYITQPALSRQIRRLEEELGVELLERSSRQVSLTLAGKRLAEDGARLLTEAALRDGRVDVGFVRLPLPVAGLETRSLYTERVCVALPAGHDLATGASVDISALADEPVLRYADAAPE
jgi:DNA-binding transcriptional LysR family regulator